MNYQRLAKSRTVHALAHRDRRVLMRTLRANTKRLLAWPQVDRDYAARQVLWARRAIEEHAE